MAVVEIEIYVPFLGCPTCMRGIKPDKKLEKLQQALLKLKEEYKNDITYLIYSLNLHLSRFRERKEIAKILQEQGDEGLPVILINNMLAFQGKYPSYDELKAVIKNN
ncbi:arsenic metallochaperone ArsD family protein [Desulfovulcanus sp.]